MPQCSSLPGRTLRRAFLRALVALALVVLPAWSRLALAAPIPPLADVELFARPGCPHCDEAKAYLKDLARERPALTTRVADVAADTEARARLEAIAMAEGAAAVSVPSFYVRGHLVVGFAGRERTGRRIEALLDGGAAPPVQADDESGTCSIEPAKPCGPAAGDTPDAVDLPLFGRLSARTLGLPLFTIAIGLVDGFNPCAMWVLLFLLSFLATLHSRPKMLLIAGVFVFVSGAAYYSFMAAWLNVFLLIGFSRAAQVVLGLVALFVGGVHVKDFFAFKKGVSFSIPERAKPTLYARRRGVVQAENLLLALASATVLAVLVNVIELLCTAGLPALYTQILVAQGLPRWKHYAYLVLYNVAYMADDMVMVGVAVVTLSRKKLQEKGGRQLKLISGVTMVLLGVLLLVKPQWLVL
jgi:glutaredoxin